jgi:hypothetical protein
MKKILSTIIALFFVFNITQAEEKIDIDKQLVGIVGAVSGTAKTNTRELKAGDKIYLNETIYAGIDSGTPRSINIYYWIRLRGCNGYLYIQSSNE